MRCAHPNVRVTITQEAQHLDLPEERGQLKPTKIIAPSTIQALVRSNPQLVLPDSQQTIDLSVGQSCVDLGSSPVGRKKKKPIAECAQPNLAVCCFCQRDYWR